MITFISPACAPITSNMKSPKMIEALGVPVSSWVSHVALYVQVTGEAIAVDALRGSTVPHNLFVERL